MCGKLKDIKALELSTTDEFMGLVFPDMLSLSIRTGVGVDNKKEMLAVCLVTTTLLLFILFFFIIVY